MTKYLAILILVLSSALSGCKPKAKPDADRDTSGESSLVTANYETAKSQDDSELNLEPESESEIAESEIVETQVDTETISEVKPEILITEVAEVDKPIEIPIKIESAAEVEPAPVEDTAQEIISKEDDKQPAHCLEDMDFFKNCDFVFKNFVDDDGMVNYITLRRKKIELLNAVRELGNIPTEMRLSWSDNDEKHSCLTPTTYLC